MIRKGNIVAIEFIDHVNGDDNPYHFVVYGRIAKVAKTSISVDSWDYVEDAQLDENITRHTIVRAAITKITKLCPSTKS